MTCMDPENASRRVLTTFLVINVFHIQKGRKASLEEKLDPRGQIVKDLPPEEIGHMEFASRHDVVSLGMTIYPLFSTLSTKETSQHD